MLQYVVMHMGKVYGPFPDQPTASAWATSIGGGGNVQPLWGTTNYVPDPLPRY